MEKQTIDHRPFYKRVQLFIHQTMCVSEIRCWDGKNINHFYLENLLNGIKMQVFFKENIEKKHLCRHDKNYYYFCKSNIPVINLIVGSRNMIKV